MAMEECLSTPHLEVTPYLLNWLNMNGLDLSALDRICEKHEIPNVSNGSQTENFKKEEDNSDIINEDSLGEEEITNAEDDTKEDVDEEETTTNGEEDTKEEDIDEDSDDDQKEGDNLQDDTERDNDKEDESYNAKDSLDDKTNDTEDNTDKNKEDNSDLTEENSDDTEKEDQYQEKVWVKDEEEDSEASEGDNTEDEEPNQDKTEMNPEDVVKSEEEKNNLEDNENTNEVGIAQEEDSNSVSVVDLEDDSQEENDSDNLSGPQSDIVSETPVKETDVVEELPDLLTPEAPEPQPSIQYHHHHKPTEPTANQPATSKTHGNDHQTSLLDKIRQFSFMTMKKPVSEISTSHWTLKDQPKWLVIFFLVCCGILLTLFITLLVLLIRYSPTRTINSPLSSPIKII